MKRLVLAVIMVLMSFSICLGATDVDTTTLLWKKGNSFAYEYTSTTSVTAGATTIFIIPIEKTVDSISEIAFESSSTAWTVFLSGVDSQTTPSIDTFLQFSETSGTLYSPTLTRPVTFYNGSSLYYIFLTISPTTVNTGNWSLKVTYTTID